MAVGNCVISIINEEFWKSATNKTIYIFEKKSRKISFFAVASFEAKLLEEYHYLSKKYIFIFTIKM